MSHPLLIFSQSGYLIQIVVINLHTQWQTVQIQISWLLQKPTDLDLHCLQNRIYPGSAGQGLSKPKRRHTKRISYVSRACIIPTLTLKVPVKTAADDILIYSFCIFCFSEVFVYFVFQRKYGLALHVNRQLCRRFTCNAKSYFL